MNFVRRWLPAVATPAFVCAMVATTTGCGALKAAANPKVAWALNDPAPMSVVVRRADVAEKTAENVDKLMTETPLNDDSPWLAKVGPESEAATKQLVELRKHDLYLTNVRIVAAEVWAKQLAVVEADAIAGTPAPDAAGAGAVAGKGAPSEKAADGSVQDGATAGDDAASGETAGAGRHAKASKKSAHAKGKKTKKHHGKVAKADKASRKGGKKAAKLAPASDSVEGASDATAAAGAGAGAGAGADAAGTGEAADGSSSSQRKYASLLAAVDKDLGDAWSKVMEKKRAIGDLKGQIAVLEAANDEKGISEADKKSNERQIDDLEKKVDALDDEADDLAKAFIPKAKEAAKKTPAEMRDKLGPVFVNLAKAVDDANIANGAAAVRYPLAATTLVDSAKTMAKIYVADVIEERTGKRPSTQALQPGVSLEGGKVNVTLNGLDSSDMGKLSVADLTSEVASRTSAWVKRTAGLLGVISATKEVLSFEDDVLSAMLDGFKSAGWSAPAAVTIPEAPPAAGAAPRS
jgi:hypothetical protein